MKSFFRSLSGTGRPAPFRRRRSKSSGAVGRSRTSLARVFCSTSMNPFEESHSIDRLTWSGRSPSDWSDSKSTHPASLRAPRTLTSMGWRAPVANAFLLSY
ncbi:MAG: hypothetical protein E6K99_10295 [Thaumarchaeota archaeon]|nr:MAG: hypothetical protein E6K99_10295 [Nitrososphaerota archaeon]